jgi:hypothetical protein
MIECFPDLLGLEERYRITNERKRRHRLGTIRYFDVAITIFEIYAEDATIYTNK